LSAFEPVFYASGGKVCHLESGLRMRFAPHFLGQTTSAFGAEMIFFWGGL